MEGVITTFALKEALTCQFNPRQFRAPRVSNVVQTSKLMGKHFWVWKGRPPPFTPPLHTREKINSLMFWGVAAVSPKCFFLGGGRVGW